MEIKRWVSKENIEDFKNKKITIEEFVDRSCCLPMHWHNIEIKIIIPDKEVL